MICCFGDCGVLCCVWFEFAVIGEFDFWLVAVVWVYMWVGFGCVKVLFCGWVDCFAEAFGFGLVVGLQLFSGVWVICVFLVGFDKVVWIWWFGCLIYGVWVVGVFAVVGWVFLRFWFCW